MKRIGDAVRVCVVLAAVPWMLLSALVGAAWDCVMDRIEEAQ